MLNFEHINQISRRQPALGHYYRYYYRVSFCSHYNISMNKNKYSGSPRARIIYSSIHYTWYIKAIQLSLWYSHCSLNISYQVDCKRIRLCPATYEGCLIPWSWLLCCRWLAVGGRTNISVSNTYYFKVRTININTYQVPGTKYYSTWIFGSVRKCVPAARYYSCTTAVRDF